MKDMWKNIAVVVLVGTTLVTVTGAILSIRNDVNLVAKEIAWHEKEDEKLEEQQKRDHDTIIKMESNLQSLLSEQTKTNLRLQAIEAELKKGNQ